MTTAKTSQLGFNLPVTGNPDYGNGQTTIAYMAQAIQALDAYVGNLQVLLAAGAITILNGVVMLHAGSAAAITLAAPVAGLPGNGGDDAQELTIIAEDAFAYTVTTPANAINGSKHIATWAAAVGNSLKLVAYQGTWYTSVAPNGVTLS